MKKIISLFLTIAMLACMIVVPASAEGNAALFYDGAFLEGGASNFTQTYCYTNEDVLAPYMQRDKTTGDFDMTLVFDFKITDVGIDEGAMVGFDVTPDMNSCINYHFGYNFTNKAFMVYRTYMPGGSITSEYQEFKRMSYDMPLNEWHEFAIRATTGRVFQMYLDGVLMLEISWDEIFAADTSGNKYDWEWNFQNRNDALDNDRWWLSLLETDMYIDNLAVYSGDYNFGTGTATETFCTETEFANLQTGSAYTGFGPFTCTQSSDCPFFYSADGGTEKVTYDREFAANHTHEMVYDADNSEVAGCLNPGYDLYTCTCGASEQRNYVEALGHLPGTLVSTDIAADEHSTGVETRRCNRCFTTYKTLINLTGETDKALHMHTKGGSGMSNGYMAIPNSLLMVQDDGVTVIADIMPISHYEKSYAAIGAAMGGTSNRYFVGYKYGLGKFVISDGDTILAESDKALNDYEWSEWMWKRDGFTVSLYIDGELVVTAELPADSYTLEGGATVGETHFFMVTTPATELLVDNIIVSGPDYDYEHKTGIIYDMVTFNNDDYSTDGGFFYGENKAIQLISYNNASGEGYQLEAHGLATENVINIHRDMALKIDSTYEDGSKWGYTQLKDSDSFIASNLSADGLDFEYSFDFYAYDWCTDETLLNGGTAFIGGHINGNANGAEGNGFVGYDFIRQQAVIGSVGGQAGEAYGDNNVYADYTIEKETWHRFTFKYDYDLDTSMYVLSVLIDGEEVLSTTMDYLTVQYYIYFPNFVKGYQDNLTVKLGGVTFEDNYDFTNGFGTTTDTMDFSGGDWSLVPGGAPTHVYDAQIFPASCLTDGYTIYTCSCGESTYTAYDQIAQGHAWDGGVVTVEPTTETEGEMTYTCSSCGETYTEVIEPLAPEFTYGDVNGDGSVKLTDASALRRFVGGAKTVTIHAEASDVNADGYIKLTDVSSLVRKVAGANITLGPAA